MKLDKFKEKIMLRQDYLIEKQWKTKYKRLIGEHFMNMLSSISPFVIKKGLRN